MEPTGECSAPFDPNLEWCDNCPLSDRSFRCFDRTAAASSSSPSELSTLGGCSFNCGGGSFFVNMGVSSVFSMDWNCEECLLVSTSDMLRSRKTIYESYKSFVRMACRKRFIGKGTNHHHHRHLLPFFSAMPLVSVSRSHGYHQYLDHAIRLATPRLKMEIGLFTNFL